jgi:Skp family chaperone for outer membrane proteins
MKRILMIITVLGVFASAAVSTSAQARPAATPPRSAAPQPAPVAKANVPNTRIAIVDTSVFADEKTGIKRFVNAVNTVRLEFRQKQAELDNLQTRIKALGEEITKLSGTSVVSPQTIQAKQEEGERLQRDWKYRKEQADADVEKRYKEIVGPISTDIGKALDQFAAQNGLTMILDITKLLPAVLSVNPAVDITQPFIAEYNSKNP